VAQPEQIKVSFISFSFSPQQTPEPNPHLYPLPNQPMTYPKLTSMSNLFYTWEVKHFSKKSAMMDLQAISTAWPMKIFGVSISGSTISDSVYLLSFVIYPQGYHAQRPGEPEHLVYPVRREPGPAELPLAQTSVFSLCVLPPC
jgi:hypothetical protein